LLVALSSVGCGRGAETPRQTEAARPAPPTTQPPPPLFSETLPAAQAQPAPAVKGKRTIAFSVDAVRRKGQDAFVEGWAFIDDGKLDARQTEIFVVLEGGGASQMFLSTKVGRDDVATRFGNVNLVESGFAVHVPLQGLPKGSLPISLYVKAKGREALQFTGKTLEND